MEADLNDQIKLLFEKPVLKLVFSVITTDWLLCF